MTCINILGVSGSIGRQALKVCRVLNMNDPGSVTIASMSCGSDWRFLAQAAREFRPAYVALADEAHGNELAAALADLPIETGCGKAAVEKAAAMPGSDITLAAISGLACLGPLVCAIRAGKTIALANKEALVASGALVKALAADNGVELRPVDSEHSALWQCLRGEERSSLSRLILTASGGPFRAEPVCLDDITPAQALAHPSWNMGPKITVDSATMVNKGLEIIEAHWLFDVDYDKIDVLVHPQSIIHSLVEYADGSQKALLSVADMCLPIQYAITGQRRLPSPLTTLDLAKIGSMTFFAPDEQRFPALRIFREAGKAGGLLPAYLNGANETLVDMFLHERITFTAISATLAKLLEKGYPGEAEDLDDVYKADAAGRADAALLADI